MISANCFTDRLVDMRVDMLLKVLCLAPENSRVDGEHADSAAWVPTHLPRIRCHFFLCGVFACGDVFDVSAARVEVHAVTGSYHLVDGPQRGFQIGNFRDETKELISVANSLIFFLHEHLVE